MLALSISNHSLPSRRAEPLSALTWQLNPQSYFLQPSKQIMLNTWNVNHFYILIVHEVIFVVVVNWLPRHWKSIMTHAWRKGENRWGAIWYLGFRSSVCVCACVCAHARVCVHARACLFTCVFHFLVVYENSLIRNRWPKSRELEFIILCCRWKKKYT